MRKLTEETIRRVQDEAFARLQNSNLLLFEGQLSARKGDFSAALARTQESYKLIEKDANPRRFEGYYGLLGLMELLQGNHSKAVEFYNKANLTNTYVQYQLALAEEGAGNKEEAKRIFRKVSTWNFNSVGFALIRKDALRHAN